MLSKLFRKRNARPCPDPDLSRVTDRLDGAEKRLALIEAELAVMRGDVSK